MPEERFMNEWRRRWTWLRIWIVVFTLLTFLSLYEIRDTQNKGRKNREEQIQALATGEILVCQQAALTLTKVLQYAQSQSRDPERSARTLAPFYRIADPDKCKNLPRVSGTDRPPSSQGVLKPG